MTFWAPFVSFFIKLIFPGGGPQSRVSESLKHKQRKQKNQALQNSDHEALLHQHKEFITNTFTVNLYISSQMGRGEKKRMVQNVLQFARHIAHNRTKKSRSKSVR
jgi:hypothetical protein